MQSSLHSRTDRTLTELDHTRVTRLLPREVGSARGANIDELNDTLDYADVVDAREVASDVVTMYSRVLLEDPATGQRQELTLCYPADADPAKGFVSVLSPVGASLLGLRVGAVASWQTPDGSTVQTRVVALVFQPEATGDYTR